ncbi:MAG TPA: hypothetical protein VHW45_18110 [Candidatus Sulfotelmatobacter sp.]|jgi:hypothetical protein|nr:hypothetical protein [Candidatus Sulfotelmatobacter sp.]
MKTVTVATATSTEIRSSKKTTFYAVYGDSGFERTRRDDQSASLKHTVE